MRSLYLSKNRLTDISPIAGLTKIWSLYIDGNQVTDLAPVAGLKWLSSFDARGNGIKDIRPLAGLTELRYLILDHNEIEDVSILVEMAEKDAGGPQRFCALLEYLSGTQSHERRSERAAAGETARTRCQGVCASHSIVDVDTRMCKAAGCARGYGCGWTFRRLLSSVGLGCSGL